MHPRTWPARTAAAALATSLADTVHRRARPTRRQLTDAHRRKARPEINQESRADRQMKHTRLPRTAPPTSIATYQMAAGGSGLSISERVQQSPTSACVTPTRTCQSRDWQRVSSNAIRRARLYGSLRTHCG
jgi:hypothetical protein